MADVWIYIDLDKQLDGIDANTTIALTFAAAKFNSLVSRGGTLSNRFQLAKTANNKRQLSLLDDPNSESDRPYLLYDCRIEVDGQPTFTGLASVEESQDYYSLRVYSGITNFFELVGDKTLRDLDLSAFDHDWTAANVNGARQNDNTDGYVYPNINYGRWTGQAIGDRPHTDFYPATYFKTLLEKAATEEGYTLNNYDTNKVIPFSLENFKSLKAGNGIASSTVLQTLTVNNVNPEDERAEFSSVVGNRLNYFSQDTVGIKNYTDIRVRSGSLNIEAVIDYEADVGNSNNVTLGIFRGNPTPETPIDFISIAPGATGTATFEINYTENTDPLNVFYIAISGTANDTLDILAGSTLSIVNSSIDILNGDVVPLEDIQPPIKIKDLFLYEAVRQNALLITDPINKTLEFISINSIRANRFTALDWSSKVDTLTEPKREYRLREYAQNNYLLYKEGIEEDPAFAANNNLGRGNFTVDDKVLNLDRDWYTAPFAASGKSANFTEQPAIILVPRYSSTGLAYTAPDLSPQPRVLDIEIDDTFLVNITGQAVLATQANATFEGFDLSVTNDYAALTEMFTRMKLLEDYVRLNAIDIANLDITKPVYLLNSYWFIREVSQFEVTSSTSTKIKLIRL